MKKSTGSVLLGVGALLLGVYVVVYVVKAMAAEAEAAAQRQVQARAAEVKTRSDVADWVKDLEALRDPTGAHVHIKGDVLSTSDAWGKQLRVQYIRGALMEKVEVRSDGPDGLPQTRDDIVATGRALNFKGVREAIKQDVGPITREKTKGVAEGAVQGIKTVFRSSTVKKK